jgi:hypothetical protein
VSAEKAAPATVLAGAAVSMTRSLLAPSEPAVPGVASVMSAAWWEPPASMMVAPLSVSAAVEPTSRSALFWPAPTV